MKSDEAVPRPAEVDRLLQRLRIRRDRLVVAAAGDSTEALARAVDEVGEDLLVADEELRVQTEQLSRSSRQLDALVAAYEDLFANAPVGYLHTDADGLILRVNRAAARLLSVSHVPRTRTLPGALRLEDRAAVRRLLTHLRTASGPAAVAAPEPLEVTILRPDGSELPVVLGARRSREPGSGRVTVHWELEERGTASLARPPVIRRHGRPVVISVADAVADLARQPDAPALLDRMVHHAHRIVSHTDGVAVAIIRSSGRVEGGAATGDFARRADAAQQMCGEGPSLVAHRNVAPVMVADLAADTRWPRFARRVVPDGVRNVVAVPLVGQRGPIGVITAYGRAPVTLDAEDAAVLAAFATQAGVVHTYADLEANLRIGLETRELVGRAVGILMERHRVTAQLAFDMLVTASQESHRKLRDIAAQVTETGEDPTAA